MKKGLSIMALILAMVLTLTLFSGNKAEAYYGGYGYSQPYAGLGYGQPYAGLGYGQPYAGFGYNQPYTGFGYNQPYTGFGYNQPYTGFGYGQPYAGFGYSAYGGGLYGSGGYYGYAGLDIVSTPGGIIMVPGRVGEPGSPVLGPGPEVLPTESNPPQNPTQPVPVSIFPPPIPSVATGPVTYPQPGALLPVVTGPVTYPVYPTGPGQLWPGFTAMPSSSPIFPQTPVYPVNPYWPNTYPTVPYPTIPGNIPVPR